MSKVNKTQLISKTHLKLKDHFRKQEISDVVSIFLDEFINELKSGKSVIVRNFIKFDLEKTKPRRFYHVVQNRISLSKGNKLIKAKLSKNLSKLIIQHLDITKTFIE